MKRNEFRECEVGDYVDAREKNPSGIIGAEDWMNIKGAQWMRHTETTFTLRSPSVSENLHFTRIEQLEPNGEMIEVWKRVS